MHWNAALVFNYHYFLIYLILSYFELILNFELQI
jgi:hypothetical protein